MKTYKNTIKLGTDPFTIKLGTDPFTTRLPFMILSRMAFLCAQTTVICCLLTNDVHAFSLCYAPAPVDNPLKGLVPYQHEKERAHFPHSMTFEYFALRDLVKGPTNYDWSPLDAQINIAANEGLQFGFEVYLDYPGRKTGIPQFLLDDGLKTIKYSQFGNNISVMPDYGNPELQMVLTNFIAALGHRFDGDPRIAFINAGLLGFWGEWHCGSNTQDFASATVRATVLTAYQSGFHKTKILLRYAGIENRDRPFGYHDDSFCWDTLGPQKWTFEEQMGEAGPRAVNKWKSEPIGGELRPELWFCIWDDISCAPTNQDFVHCVEMTHASWIRDSGVFERPLAGGARVRALAAARKLGYEFFVKSAAITPEQGGARVTVTITNSGVAPFYYEWPMELAAAADGRILKTWQTPWHITGILPGEAPKEQTTTLRDLPQGKLVILLRVDNPLPNGKPLRFANETQDQTISGWLTLEHLE